MLPRHQDEPLMHVGLSGRPIMPTVVSGNTIAATMMIGERAADMARHKSRLAA